MRLVTSLNHSSPPIQVKRLYSGSTPFECCQTYLIPVLLHDRRFVDKIEIYKSEIQTGSNHGEMAVSMNDRGTISDPISLLHFWLRRLRQNSFFTEILWNFLYRIKRDAPPAPPRIPQKFHNFLDFYTAPPKFTHAPPKFTHFRSMSSGDISILVEWLKVNISPELPMFKNGSADEMNVTWSEACKLHKSCMTLLTFPCIHP